jgi:hypothetical protein
MAMAMVTTMTTMARVMKLTKMTAMGRARDAPLRLARLAYFAAAR